METIILNVEGMSCNHCVGKIEGALNKLEGVCHSKVSLADNTKIDVNALEEAIVDTGYQVVA